ncbi:hypothetical protein BK127_06835 [Paenibacillus sp. FSL H7-0331]|nr:hypothetical protein BK127_06835 [Paenibacillus sp. FSL H7-0331]
MKIERCLGNEPDIGHNSRVDWAIGNRICGADGLAHHESASGKTQARDGEWQTSGWQLSAFTEVDLF